MSLSLSFHTNFVQMARAGRTHWAPRANWEDPAQEMLKKLAPDEPIVLSMADAELEVSRSLNPSLTLVFPDGLQDWLSLQVRSLPPDQRESLSTLLATSQCLPESEWSSTSPALLFSLNPKASSPHPNVSVFALPENEDEISTWTRAIAEVTLKEKLKQECGRFLKQNPHHQVYTWTASGLEKGLHSPLLGLPTALSHFLKDERQASDNHLFLGWENFFFSYRDSRGSWHSQALPLQPLNSFKIDPHLKILPEPQGKLFLPMCMSLSPRPTLFDVFQQSLPWPYPTDPMSPHRLRDSFAAFFNLKWSNSSLSFLTQTILEEIFWSAESLRTSETCLIEGPLAPLFYEQTPKPAPQGFELGSETLMEVNFGPGRTP